MKSKKTRASLLLTFSLLLFTSAATAETVEITQVANRYPWNGKLDVAYSLAGLVSGKSYQLVTAVTVGGTTRAVTNGLGSVTDGGYTNTVRPRRSRSSPTVPIAARVVVRRADCT